MAIILGGSVVACPTCDVLYIPSQLNVPKDFTELTVRCTHCGCVFEVVTEKPSWKTAWQRRHKVTLREP